MKVSELHGALLDYWVARAVGASVSATESIPKYSSVPEAAMPILAMGRITTRQMNDGKFRASFDNTYVWFEDESMLTAAMRARVFKAFGSELPPT